MALNAAIVWEIRTTGSDSSGGGFKAGATGVDRSQQNAAHATLSAASVVHTTTSQINVSAGDYTVSADDVGNLLQITGGTATAGFFEITVADVANNRWTVDRAAGTAGQTVVGAMGGALASPGKLGTVPVNGNTIFLKAGTYDMSVNTANVANGKWSDTFIGRMIGYDTNRVWGNVDTKPVIRATVVLTTMWTASSVWVYNVEFNANSQATTRHVSGGAYTRCSFINGSLSNTMDLSTHCTATGNSASAFDGDCFYCEAWGNSATPFVATNATLGYCLAYDNTGASTDGFVVSISSSGHFFHCIAVNNGRDGFRTGSSNSRAILQNCIAEDNAGWGVDSITLPVLVIRCAFDGNGSGAVTGEAVESGTLSPAATVFTNAAAGDFSLNNTAGNGALLREAGYISIDGAAYPRGLTTTFADVGGAQHEDAGAGATVYVPIQSVVAVPMRTSMVGY